MHHVQRMLYRLPPRRDCGPREAGTSQPVGGLLILLSKLSKCHYLELTLISSLGQCAHQNSLYLFTFVQINVILQVALRIGIPAFMFCFTVGYFGYVIFHIYPSHHQWAEWFTKPLPQLDFPNLLLNILHIRHLNHFCLLHTYCHLGICISSSVTHMSYLIQPKWYGFANKCFNTSTSILSFLDLEKSLWSTVNHSISSI